MSASGRVTYLETRETIDFTTGEVMAEERTTHLKVATEPNYIKLYIDCLLSFKELSRNLNPILLEFLKHMTYASTADNTGGQIISITAYIKRDVAQNVGLKIDRVNQSVTQFVKAGIFRRIAPSTYQVNPNMFGKGEWRDIQQIRASFDFNKRTVRAEIIRGEESE